MIIRHSTASDIPTLLRLADEARQIMRRSGNMNQWVNGYPDRAAFESDIQQQGSYIVENDLGEPVGCFAMLPGPETTYARIYEGQLLDTERPYYVIHRIASLPQAHGVLRAIIDHAFLMILSPENRRKKNVILQREEVQQAEVLKYKSKILPSELSHL